MSDVPTVPQLQCQGLEPLPVGLWCVCACACVCLRVHACDRESVHEMVCDRECMYASSGSVREMGWGGGGGSDALGTVAGGAISAVHGLWLKKSWRLAQLCGVLPAALSCLRTAGWNRKCIRV